MSGKAHSVNDAALFSIGSFHTDVAVFAHGHGRQAATIRATGRTNIDRRAPTV